ncbi:MAG: heme exporter protein CcmB [Rhodospirillaceae bacterium]|nr:heme exporter protein CcmB [Rhodospirillaceae bacterium]
MSVFAAVLKRDLALALRQSADSFTVLAFFAIAVVLFPLGVGPESNTLAKIAGGVLWVSALLAALLSLDRLFTVDFEDGTLDQLVLSGEPLVFVVLAKTAAHWLTTGLPLILLSPVLALTLHLPGEGYGALLAALSLGTPTVSLIGAVGAALVLGSRRGGVLLSFLVLPLYVPILIFGTLSVEGAILGVSVKATLSLLGAMASFAVILAPWAAAAALRQATE